MYLLNKLNSSEPGVFVKSLTLGFIHPVCIKGNVIVIVI